MRETRTFRQTNRCVFKSLGARGIVRESAVDGAASDRSGGRLGTRGELRSVVGRADHVARGVPGPRPRAVRLAGHGQGFCVSRLATRTPISYRMEAGCPRSFGDYSFSNGFVVRSVGGEGAGLGSWSTRASRLLNAEWYPRTGAAQWRTFVSGKRDERYAGGRVIQQDADVLNSAESAHTTTDT